jgi:DNA helicase HerA-like ATPase
MDTAFTDAMRAGYDLSEPSIDLGRPMLGGEVATGVPVRVALSMLNRHGLVAGATGTGKTKTLQLLAGQLSAAGVPCFVADVKGDVTGIAEPGDAANQRVVDRCAKLGITFVPAGHPVELLSLTGKLGAPVRATVHSFGPTLLAKVLDLNETQTAVLSLVFAYCDDNDLPLLDLADLRTTLQYLGSDDAREAVAAYGGISTATIGVILRSILMLEQQGARDFFGEPEFDVADLLRTTDDGRGIVSLLELSDVMDRPRLFSTFMLWLLAQLYATLPEVGDLPKPRLCFFFDEAHLLFQDASDALMEQIERTARLVRSKGVGIYFVTQAPTDVPASVLGQLGNRVQHALRAFTPQDADDLRKTVRTFPTSPFYSDVGAALTSLGIGEALVTVLSPTGVPTPLAATRLLPPDSLMAALPPDRIAAIVAASPIAAKYRQPVDRDSAHEMITRRIAEAKAAAPAVPAQTPAQAARAEAAHQRELERQAAATERAMQAEARRREKERAAAERAAARDAAAAQRAAERHQQEMLRAGTRILTSRTGQQAIRSIFGTLFGGSGKR